MPGDGLARKNRPVRYIQGCGGNLHKEYRTFLFLRVTLSVVYTLLSFCFQYRTSFSLDHDGGNPKPRGFLYNHISNILFLFLSHFQTIAEHSAVSRRQAINSIRKLEKLYYITTEKGDRKRKFANVYTLLKTRSAKFAPVQKKGVPSAKNEAHLVQNSTSNNNNRTIINNNIDFNKINDGKQQLYKKLGWDSKEREGGLVK